MAEQQPTPASPAGGSSSTAAAAGGAPAHTAFPTATELLGRMGAPRAPAKPSSPEAFLQFITTPGPPPVPYLESLANGPLMPPLASGSKGTPSQLLFLNGLDIATLPPAAVQAGTLGFLYVLYVWHLDRADDQYRASQCACGPEAAWPARVVCTLLPACGP
jgi:hypothetical protein